MKTMTPRGAVQPDHDVSEASAKSAVSSNTPADSSGNPMSEMGDMKPENGLSYTAVHCESSGPGKFDFGFMESETKETPMEVPVHATGAYPVAGGREEAYAKPTHAPGTYAPTE